MNRLGIDTATERATVAVGDDAGPWEHAALEGARRQASDLLSVVDAVLRRTGTRVSELSGIVVGDGPGSFTGLRVGWALTRGLAQAHGLAVTAVPSLMGHARSAALIAAVGRRPVAVCFDALRGQVFGAVYAFVDGTVTTLVAPAVVTIAELAARTPLRPAVAVGDGAERYAAAVRDWTGADPYRPGHDVPPVAGSLLALRASAGRPLDDPTSAEPVYGRAAEAQVKWETRHGRPLPDSRR